MKPVVLSAALASAVALGGTARAINPAAWTIDETITRQQSERFWVSPTAIDLGLEGYSYSYEITRIDATVLGAPIDITSLVAESFDLTGDGAAPDVPFVLLDDAINDPSTGTAADVRIEVDDAGFGRASFTSVVLGRASTPFGTFDIDAVRVRAEVTLSGVVATQPGDYNGDGAVDPSDYDAWRDAYGAAGPHQADGNGNGVVDAADYTIWRDRWESPLDAVSIPEPAGAAIALLAGGLALVGRHRV